MPLAGPGEGHGLSKSLASQWQLTALSARGTIMMLLDSVMVVTVTRKRVFQQASSVTIAPTARITRVMSTSGTRVVPIDSDGQGQSQ